MGMSLGILWQYVFSGLMLGIIYALVAVGFTLFFGVLDVIQFAHGDVLTMGAYFGYAAYLLFSHIGVRSHWLLLLAALTAAMLATGVIGALIGRYLVLPLRSGPTINVLVATLMLGTFLREAIRLFFPDGSNPKDFPDLLPARVLSVGALKVRTDSLMLLGIGALVIVAVYFAIHRSRLGLAIRAVAQDGETAQVMGINFDFTVLATFVLGSALAGFAGIMVGLYYNELTFDMGLLLGVIGFSAAVIGGLGNVYGAIIGGFLFSALQSFGAVALPALVPSVSASYENVFAFTVVIVLMVLRPSGILAEKASERV